VKVENGDLLADYNNILNKKKNYYSQLLNVPGVSDSRQKKIHIAQPLVLHLSPFEVEIAIATLKKYEFSSNVHIPAELIQSAGEILYSVFHKIIFIRIKRSFLIIVRSLLL
jgi:hypothetical protein